MKKAKKHNGFTLVELLIVIVVIGVLSAMMMLSSTEAVSSAKAANIINNLRNWKTATLAWYTDNIDKVNGYGRIKNTDNNYNGDFAPSGPVKLIDIAKYLGDSNKFTEIGGKLKDSSGGEYYSDYAKVSQNGKDYYNWYIVYEMPNDDKRLQQKLEARASTANLSNKHANYNTYEAYTSAGGGKTVSICVIDFTK